MKRWAETSGYPVAGGEKENQGSIGQAIGTGKPGESSTRKGMEGPALKIRLAPKDKGKQYLRVPRVPMIGPGGVVANLLTAKTDQIEAGMSVLMMSGKDNQAANISFQGPCYFLDVAFENFETAIAIDSASSDKPV